MSQDQVLSALAAGKLTIEQAKALLDPPKALSLKVSEKGGISVYGLQRMPVTLYGEQWARLLEFGEQIKAFAKANANKLSTKADKAKAA